MCGGRTSTLLTSFYDISYVVCDISCDFSCVFCISSDTFLTPFSASAESGYKRQCHTPTCSASSHVQSVSHPRTDAVVIALVLNRDRSACLLGRGPRHPPGFYSALAGFMEPGESIEDAVRREIAEETGVHVGRVAYHSSQPCPFPAQIMIGCIAEALTEELTLDKEEIEDARWFTKEEIRGIREGKVDREGKRVTLPMGFAIASSLLKTWLEDPAARL